MGRRRAVRGFGAARIKEKTLFPELSLSMNKPRDLTVPRSRMIEDAHDDNVQACAFRNRLLTDVINVTCAAWLNTYRPLSARKHDTISFLRISCRRLGIVKLPRMRRHSLRGCSVGLQL